MAVNKIRVLIVDDIAETRENVRKLLQFESDVDVTGAARSGKEDSARAGTGSRCCVDGYQYA